MENIQQDIIMDELEDVLWYLGKYKNKLGLNKYIDLHIFRLTRSTIECMCNCYPQIDIGHASDLGPDHYIPIDNFNFEYEKGKPIHIADIALLPIIYMNHFGGVDKICMNTNYPDSTNYEITYNSTFSSIFANGTLCDGCINWYLVNQKRLSKHVRCPKTFSEWYECGSKKKRC